MNYQMEELVPIVAELTAQYTSKESTSVPYAVAEQLMGAVIYCIEEYEQSQSNGLFGEKGLSAKAVYRAGKQFIMEKVKRAKELYHAILPEFHDYGNQAYRETVLEGMPKFFVQYDFHFCPQEHLLTLYYPVLVQFPTVMCGIDLIYAYLHVILLEQKFLKEVPEEYITFLTSSCLFDFTEAFVNVPALVMKNMLGCRLAERKISTLSYTKQECERLRINIIHELEAGTLEQSLLQELSNIVLCLSDVDEEMEDYLKLYIPDFCAELENALKNDCLNAVLVL